MRLTCWNYWRGMHEAFFTFLLTIYKIYHKGENMCLFGQGKSKHVRWDSIYVTVHFLLCLVRSGVSFYPRSMLLDRLLFPQTACWPVIFICIFFLHWQDRGQAHKIYWKYDLSALKRGLYYVTSKNMPQHTLTCQTSQWLLQWWLTLESLISIFL
jgi:hypothetical protein